MATFKLLAFTFTILYFFAFSAARISLPLTVKPDNGVINRDTVTSDHVSKSGSKRTIFLPTPDHDPSDQVISVELEPEDVEQLTKLKNDEHKLLSDDPTNVDLTKFNNKDLNDNHKSSDELENETTNHMTQSKNKERGKSDQDFPIKEPHEFDQDFPIKEPHDFPVKEHHESDNDMSVLSENTISIETLHLNPSNYFRIRPINRHFRVNPSVFRIHRCHHHHHLNHAYQNHRQVPYGNDMILSREDMILAREDNEQFDPSTLHISTQSVLPKRPMIHHYHHHDEDENMMMRHPFRQYIAKQKLKKQVEEEIQQRKEMDERKQGGFMKSFRKFLNHF